MKKFSQNIFHKLISPFLVRIRMNRLKKVTEAGLPKQMLPVLTFLITKSEDKQASRVAQIAENRRIEIGSKEEKKMPIWYSPKPVGATVDENNRPVPGKKLEFSMKQIANTGKNREWGIALYLLAREFKCSVGLELGTCAGISSMYIASAPSFKKLLTVEGSLPLAKTAEESLENFKNVKVVNKLFDEAIDIDLPKMKRKIDLAYIDGHHEKTATIHYFNRLIPYLENKSVVIFDDISWSIDMREAWEELSKRQEFSHCMDLGGIGVCIFKADHKNKLQNPKYWNLQPIVGKSKIGKPHGWNK